MEASRTWASEKRKLLEGVLQMLAFLWRLFTGKKNTGTKFEMSFGVKYETAAGETSPNMEEAAHLPSLLEKLNE